MATGGALTAAEEEGSRLPSFGRILGLSACRGAGLPDLESLTLTHGRYILLFVRGRAVAESETGDPRPRAKRKFP